MRVSTNEIMIYLEKDEIFNLWSVLLFACDYHCEKREKGVICMSEKELKLCTDLIDILDKLK